MIINLEFAKLEYVDMDMTRRYQEQGVQEGLKVLEQFNREAENAYQTNCAFLMKTLRDNADTEYGRKYGFASVNSVEEFQKKVPVVVYDQIAEQIERMAAGEKRVLTAYEFNHMNSTSGTVGNVKLIPMTNEQADIFVKYDLLLGHAVRYRYLDEEWMNGRSFATSEGVHHTLPSGITYGSASSKMAQYIQGGIDAYDEHIRMLFTSPVEASLPTLGDDTKYIHCRFALMDDAITGIVTGFFSQVVLLLSYISSHYKMLVDDIESGTISDEIRLAPATRQSLMRKLVPMPERAAKLRSIFRNGADFGWLPQVWPKLMYIRGAGTDGFSVYDKIIKERFGGENLRCFYSGLASSEALSSVCIEPDSPSSVMLPNSAFFEFLPVDAGNDFSRIVTMDGVEPGKVYELIITNASGFYRYRTNDAVKVTGFYRRTPRIEFMYRTNRMINMVGEKVTEKDLQWAVEHTCEDLHLSLMDFSVYAECQETPGRYIFLVELVSQPAELDRQCFAEVLEEYMCEACFIYRYELKAHNIAPLKLLFLQPETNFLYRDMMAMRGESPSQLKPVRIIMNERQRRFFFRLTEEM